MKHIIFIIALCCICTAVKAQNTDKDDDDEYACILYYEPFPEFPGGTDSLMTFLARNIHYPEKAVKARIEGRCFVEFVIDKDGSVVDPKVIKSLSPECDEEAIRAVKLMPKWKPGIHHDEPVRVKYTIPIMFKLPQEETK